MGIMEWVGARRERSLEWGINDWEEPEVGTMWWEGPEMGGARNGTSRGGRGRKWGIADWEGLEVGGRSLGGGWGLHSGWDLRVWARFLIG